MKNVGYIAILFSVLITRAAFAESVLPVNVQPPCWTDCVVNPMPQIDADELWDVGGVTLEIRARFVERIREETLDVVATAYHATPNSKAKALYEEIWLKLKAIEIEFTTPGEEFTYCLKKGKEEMVAWAEDGRFYLCARYLKTLGRPIDKYAYQVFVHETFHLIRENESECDAVKAEYSVMNDAGQTPDQNGYTGKGEICEILKTNYRISN